MAFFNEFPFARTYDSDLGWLIRRIQEVSQIVDEYVSLNSIQFADPINWNITTQYPRLTIVLDRDGGAYISRQPVPAGVSLTNTEYWTEIYNTAAVIDSIRGNIAHDNGDVDTATELIAEGNLFWYAGDLYLAVGDIAAGNRFVVGTNCRRMTVDEKINLATQTVENAISQEAQARAEADAALGQQIGAEVQARMDADAAEAQARAAADASLEESLQQVIAAKYYIDVKADFGAKGDGVTDDTQAFIDAISSANEQTIIIIPEGNYLVGDLGEIEKGITIRGCGMDNTFLIRHNNTTRSMFDFKGGAYSVEISNLRLLNGGKNYDISADGTAAIKFHSASNGQYIARDVWVDSGRIGVWVENIGGVLLDNLFFFQETAYANNYPSDYGLLTRGHVTNMKISNCVFSGQDLNNPNLLNIGALFQGADGIQVVNTQFNVAKTAVVFTNQYANVDDIYFSNCIFDNVKNGYMSSEGGTNYAFLNIHFEGCHFDSTGSVDFYGFIISPYIKNLKFIGCFIGATGGDGFLFNTGNCFDGSTDHEHIISGCNITWGNIQQGQGKTAIRVGDMSGISIIGNIITNNGIAGGTPIGHYAYGAVFGNTKDVVFVGNRITGMETDAIYRGGITDSIFAGNLPTTIND